MNTAQLKHPKHPAHSMKTLSRIPRIVAVSAALGLACVAGAATTASAVAATPHPHVATDATAARTLPAHSHGPSGMQGRLVGNDDYGDDCDGLIVLLCH
ncbi:hypothetical protein ACH41H_41010 [Streptomyces sp. NPDC020800]|uniref:hypothetical protein n=1 Tax=Streptomyces sp. NPDC020800 TaxID=3365092 RepID=UPI00378FB981